MFTCAQDDYLVLLRSGFLDGYRVNGWPRAARLGTSLRAQQVWADLSRHLGPRCCSTERQESFQASDHDVFGILLAAQRETVDELVANYREIFATTPRFRLAQRN